MGVIRRLHPPVSIREALWPGGLTIPGSPRILVCYETGSGRSSRGRGAMAIEVNRLYLPVIPSSANKKEYRSASCLIRSLKAVPIPWPAVVVVRRRIGLADLFAASRRAIILRE